jgi:hypothetical protein
MAAEVRLGSALQKSGCGRRELNLAYFSHWGEGPGMRGFVAFCSGFAPHRPVAVATDYRTALGQLRVARARLLPSPRKSGERGAGIHACAAGHLRWAPVATASIGH